MSNIGTLSRNAADNTLKGRIQTISTNVSFGLVQKQVEGDGATHAIVVGVNGQRIEVGRAWENDIKRGDLTGRTMYSMNFSDPDLPDWMSNLAAFPISQASQDYRIQVSKPRQSGAQVSTGDTMPNDTPPADEMGDPGYQEPQYN